MSRSSEDLTKAANELQAKLEKLRREARRVKKLEEQQKAEEYRQQEIEKALEFVEFTKGIYYPDSEVTVYEFITTVMDEAKTGKENSEEYFTYTGADGKSATHTTWLHMCGRPTQAKNPAPISSGNRGSENGRA